MRPIQKEFFTLTTVVYDNREAARSGNHKLLKLLVGVPPSRRPRRHIVQVIGTPDQEGDVAIPFDKSKVAPLIRNFWQIEDAGDFPRHLWHTFGWDTALVGLDPSPNITSVALLTLIVLLRQYGKNPNPNAASHHDATEQLIRFASNGGKSVTL